MEKSRRDKNRRKNGGRNKSKKLASQWGYFKATGKGNKRTSDADCSYDHKNRIGEKIILLNHTFFLRPIKNQATPMDRRAVVMSPVRKGMG